MTAALQQAQPVTLRAGQPGDLPFVASTWLRHFRRRSVMAQSVAEVTYTTEQRALIQTILARAVVTVACDSSDPSLIMGYVVSSDRAIHWLQVKAVFQGHGLGRLLIGTVATPLYWSHDVQGAADLSVKFGMRLTYNPYRAWSGL